MATSSLSIYKIIKMSWLSRQKYSIGGFEMETSNFAHISCPKLCESYRPMVPGGALRICFFFQENQFFLLHLSTDEV